MMVNGLPFMPRTKLNGLSPLVGSLILQIASGFLKISLGPMKPFIALLIHSMATSVDKPAEAPFESDNYLPALIALKGI